VQLLKRKIRSIAVIKRILFLGWYRPKNEPEEMPLFWDSSPVVFSEAASNSARVTVFVPSFQLNVMVSFKVVQPILCGGIQQAVLNRRFRFGKLLIRLAES